MSVPSRRKLFCSGRAPLIEILGVRPPTTSLPAASAACTPGWRRASCWNDRPLRGRSRISFSPTSPLTAPEVRFTREASASTTTSSLILPRSRATSRTASWPTVSRTPRRSTVWNPVIETLTSYSPGGSSGAWYRPLGSVTSSRTSPVPALRTATCAPAMACPLPSLTVPWMLPPTFWAWTGSAQRRPVARMNPRAPFARMGTPFRRRLSASYRDRLYARRAWKVTGRARSAESRGCSHRIGLAHPLGRAPPEVLRLREHVDLDRVEPGGGGVADDRRFPRVDEPGGEGGLEERLGGGPRQPAVARRPTEAVDDGRGIRRQLEGALDP